MKDDTMLYCIIAFILGWLVSKMMGNGFSVGCQWSSAESRAQRNQGNDTSDFSGWGWIR